MLKKNKQTHCTYISQHKDVKAQRQDHALRLAYYGCKNHTHTSKIRQVKRTPMVATPRFTMCVFVIISDCKESNATKSSRERMWALNQNRRQKVFNSGALHLRRRTWHSEIFIKSPLNYSVSYFDLEGWAHHCTPWQRDWFKLPLCCHYWNTKEIKSFNQRIQ